MEGDVNNTAVVDGGGVDAVVACAGVCEEGELSIVALGEAGGVVADGGVAIDKAATKSVIGISWGSCPTTYIVLRFFVLLVASSYTSSSTHTAFCEIIEIFPACFTFISGELAKGYSGTTC